MLGYHADGTGRDTYIRRDPVVSYGKRECRHASNQLVTAATWLSEGAIAVKV